MAGGLPSPVRAKLGISNAVIIVLRRLDFQIYKYDIVIGVHVGHMKFAIKV